MSSLVPFTIDLTQHEGARLAAVLTALGPNWDPTQIYTSETQARQMLYANLNPNQQAAYDVLVTNGVLPPTKIPEAVT